MIFDLYQPDENTQYSTEIIFSEDEITTQGENDKDLIGHIVMDSEFKGTYNLFIKYSFLKNLNELNQSITYSSNPSSIIDNENFQKIIKMGKKAVPFILEDLAEKPSHLVWAMNFITNQKISSTPISIDKAARKWVNWGKKVNLISNA